MITLTRSTVVMVVALVLSIPILIFDNARVLLGTNLYLLLVATVGATYFIGFSLWAFDRK